jgi:hypothetical protein
MKKYTLLFPALFFLFSAYAQINYPPAIAQNVAGTYSDLGASGTVITTANFDDANSAPVPIGFNFSFNGNTQTHFVLNTNGFIKLGTSAAMTAPSSANLFYAAGNNYTGGIFNSANPNDINLVSAFNHDLDAAASGAEFRTSTAGTVGSRVCTIQYRNMLDKTTVPYNQYDSINFQIKLYETTNIIEFIYGDFYASSDSSRFKSSACGLKGNSLTDITCVTKGSTVAWNAATFLYGNYTGNAFNFGNDNVGDGAGPNGGRPMPDAGRTLRFTPAFANDVAVTKLYTLGSLPVPYGLPHTMTARISNVGVNPAIAFKVYLEVTGANSYNDTITVATLAVGGSLSLNFTGFTPQNYGVNNVKVYIDADDYTGNDSVLYYQEITTDTYGYIDTLTPNGGVGYNMGTGLILAKYRINGSRYITGVDIYLNNDVAGNSMYAVAMDPLGNIAGQSSLLLATAANASSWNHFEINPPVLVKNNDIYVGLAQLTNPTIGYFPVGTVTEDPVRSGAYFSTGIGGSATPTDFQGSALNIQPAIKGIVNGTDAAILGLSNIPPATLCPTENQVIEVLVQNRDSMVLDFAVDTMEVEVSTVGASPVLQTFKLTVNTGTLSPGAIGTFLVTPNFDFSAAGVYSVEVKLSQRIDVDTLNNKKTVVVEVLGGSPSVAITVSPSNTVCFGDSVTFTALPKTAGSMNYQWKVDGNNLGPVTTDSILGNTTLLSSKVTVDLITEDCNLSPIVVSSNEEQMTINPPPIAVAGKDTVLENTTERYFFAPRSNTVTFWTVTGGVPDVSTGNDVKVNWGVAGKGNLSIHETTQTSCEYITDIPIEIVSIVGIEQHNSNELSLANSYPNPARMETIIGVYAPHKTWVSIRLYNLTGNEVRRVYDGEIVGSKSILLNVEGLDSGIYFYEMSAEGHRFVKKLTVSN